MSLYTLSRLCATLVPFLFPSVRACVLADAFAEATPYQKVADGGMNVALILGPTFSPAELMAKDISGTKVR